jgi:hypothetical protein
MKSILYSICIGSLALALTAGAAQAANEKRPERAKPQQRTAKVQTARPANTGRTMNAHRNVSAAQYRQRSYAKPRTNSTVNRATRPASTTPATARERNLAVNRHRNLAVNRTRNLDANRERNAAVNRTRNADVNRYRNANEFRGRNNVAINRNRNVAVNRTGNAAYYRGGNARITNNWRGDAFRGQRYAAFRNYHRQWHDRSWWTSHYNRIVFVNNGWYYWNAGYWFPAWGYAPSVSYVYDGPIYGYNELSPDQVTVNVQEQLARAGYYDGPIDGMLGPMTREAIAAYQADNGLAVTSAIDEPTLATLGLV